jgi:hypothetical protein
MNGRILAISWAAAAFVGLLTAIEGFNVWVGLGAFALVCGSFGVAYSDKGQRSWQFFGNMLPFALLGLELWLLPFTQVTYLTGIIFGFIAYLMWRGAKGAEKKPNIA